MEARRQMFRLLSYISQEHLFKGDINHSELGPPTSIKKMHCRFAHSPIWWRHFSHLRSPFTRCPELVSHRQKDNLQRHLGGFQVSYCHQYQNKYESADLWDLNFTFGEIPRNEIAGLYTSFVGLCLFFLDTSMLFSTTEITLTCILTIRYRVSSTPHHRRHWPHRDRHKWKPPVE